MTSHRYAMSATHDPITHRLLPRALWWDGQRGGLACAGMFVDLFAAPHILLYDAQDPRPVDGIDYVPDKGYRSIRPTHASAWRSMTPGEAQDVERMLDGIAQQARRWVYRQQDKWPDQA
jgi:hypothetical protein